MKGNTKFLQEKIHFPDTKSRWVIIILITLWAFFILYSLQPFGINFAKNKFTIIVLNTAGIFLTCATFIQGLPLVFRRYYAPDKLTTGKLLGMCLIVITAFSALDAIVLSTYIDDLEGVPYFTHFPLLERFFMFWIASLFISVCPVSIIYCILVKKERKKTRMQAVAHIMPADGNTGEDNARVIELSGKTKDHIRLLPEDILYIKASGNYATIYYLKDEKESHKLLRISMSELNDSLRDYPYIIRCHRAFMVNMKKTKNIHGNLKGYQIELKDTDTKIPVSKSYTRIVKEKITHVGIY